MRPILRMRAGLVVSACKQPAEQEQNRVDQDPVPGIDHDAFSFRARYPVPGIGGRSALVCDPRHTRVWNRQGQRPATATALRESVATEKPRPEWPVFRNSSSLWPSRNSRAEFWSPTIVTMRSAVGDGGAI